MIGLDIVCLSMFGEGRSIGFDLEIKSIRCMSCVRSMLDIWVLRYYIKLCDSFERDLNEVNHGGGFCNNT